MAVINNTFTEIDDAAIVKAQFQADGIVFFNGFSDITGGETSNRYFLKEIRYSYDNVLFSDWIQIVDNLINFELEIISGFLFLEYRYTRKGTDPGGILTWSAVDLDSLNSRSFLPKLQTLTDALYPTGWAWKNKLSDAQVVAPGIEPVTYLISVTTIVDTLLELSVTYGLSPAPLWVVGNQQEIGATVDFIFTTEFAKTIEIYADDIDALDGNQLIFNPGLIEVDLSRSKSDLNIVDPFDNKLRRLYGPISTAINHIDLTLTQIEYLNFKETIFNSANIQLQKVPQLYAFIQPKAPWSVSSFTITESTIFDTLNLNKLTIKGGLALVDNWFLEGVAFNASADYSEALSFRIDNCTLLKYVDFSIMNGILSAQDSTVAATEIGAVESDVDAMLLALKNIVPNNLNTGRVIDLRRNAAPGAAGLIYKTQLENIGITVYTE